MLRPGRRAVALVAPTSLRRGSRLNSDNGRLHCFCDRLRIIVTPPRALHPSWRPRLSPPITLEIILVLGAPAGLSISRAIESRATYYIASAAFSCARGLHILFQALSNV